MGHVVEATVHRFASMNVQLPRLELDRKREFRSNYEAYIRSEGSKCFGARDRDIAEV